MSSNEARATALVRALRAAIERDRETLGALLTDDVRAWTPTLSTSSLSELFDELERRDDAFSDFALDATPLDVGGDYACVEWTVAMTNTGRITLDSDHSIGPTGTRVTVHGVTVAEFDGDRICSVRQYWDENGLLEQLGATAEA
jgi:ketosteroid isomerase-like protein